MSNPIQAPVWKSERPIANREAWFVGPRDGVFGVIIEWNARSDLWTAYSFDERRLMVFIGCGLTHEAAIRAVVRHWRD